MLLQWKQMQETKYSKRIYQEINLCRSKYMVLMIEINSLVEKKQVY